MKVYTWLNFSNNIFKRQGQSLLMVTSQKLTVLSFKFGLCSICSSGARAMISNPEMPLIIDVCVCVCVCV